MSNHHKPMPKSMWGTLTTGDDSPGIPISTDHVIANIDDAIANLGREAGRIGTILQTTTDPILLGDFMNLYARCLAKYADLLLKKNSSPPTATSPPSSPKPSTPSTKNSNWNSKMTNNNHHTGNDKD